MCFLGVEYGLPKPVNHLGTTARALEKVRVVGVTVVMGHNSVGYAMHTNEAFTTDFMHCVIQLQQCLLVLMIWVFLYLSLSGGYGMWVVCGCPSGAQHSST